MNDIFIKCIGNFDKTMKTTLSAFLIIDGKFYDAQVGDSRIYLFRDNTAFQITSNHSYIAELAEKGLMTFDKAKVAEKKNFLTRCIGNMSDFLRIFIQEKYSAVIAFQFQAMDFTGD